MKAPAAVLAGLTLVLAGCGSAGHVAAPAPSSAVSSSAVSSSAASSSAASTVQSGQVAIAIRDFMFQPMTITVRAGTRVTWTQDDASVHTVTDAGVFSSGPLAQGASFSHTFTGPGTYHYVCTIHTYMLATVTVVG